MANWSPIWAFTRINPTPTTAHLSNRERRTVAIQAAAFKRPTIKSRKGGQYPHKQPFNIKKQKAA